MIRGARAALPAWLAGAVALSPGSAAAAPAQPTITIAPNIVQTGHPTNVFGFTFCPTPECAPVSLSLDANPLPGSVQVRADGTFSARFVATRTGTSTLVAAQRQASGLVSASITFAVVHGEAEQAGGPDPDAGEDGDSEIEKLLPVESPRATATQQGPRTSHPVPLREFESSQLFQPAGSQAAQEQPADRRTWPWWVAGGAALVLAAAVVSWRGRRS